MGVGASVDSDVQHAGNDDVGNVTAAPGEEPSIFEAADLGTEKALAHCVSLTLMDGEVEPLPREDYHSRQAHQKVPPRL